MASGSHLSKELFEFVKAIGESKSKQEEDKIIGAEVATLKLKISEPGILPKRMKEMLLRALYIEMLGHEASFAYIHAINLTNCGSVVSKRVGYIACASCLPTESPLLILLVANLQRDLQSPNYLEISAALTAVCKLVNAGFLHAFNEQVLRLTSHSHELIRKKAVIVLSRFFKMSPGLLTEYFPLFKKTLCDKDPAVMGASLNCFFEIVQCSEYVPLVKDLISNFSIILKQIMDQRLPRDFDYHRLPAPWLQMKILQIFAVLGENDQKASQQMYEVISDCMKRAEEVTSNIGYAVVYQCMKTITAIYPSVPLIESSANLVSAFITSENNNLKYTGVTGLMSIVKINPIYSLRHQMVVVDCLEDQDNTLKRQTLNLLYKMTNTQNVKVIIEKFTKELNSVGHDSHLKQELVVKITELAEKFASDPRWYLKTTNSVFENASDCISPAVVNNLIKLIDEWRDDPATILFTVNEYFLLLGAFDVLPDCLMQVSAWVLGEFGEVLGSEKLDKVIVLLCQRLFKRYEDPLTKGWILTALQKVTHGVPSEECRDMISRFSTSKNEDLQQRCYEFAGSTTKLASIPSFKDNMNLQVSFDFLNQYVQQDLIQGGKHYNKEKDRKGLGYLLNRTSEYKASEALQSMRMEPYQAPVREVQIKVQQSHESEVKDNSSRIFPQPRTEWNKSAAQNWLGAKGISEKETAKQAFVSELFGGMGQTKPSPPAAKKQPENLLEL